MAHVFLVVKGTEQDAHTAAIWRNIPIVIVGSYEDNSHQYAHAAMNNLRKIIDWYCEDAGKQAPYASGSCLWYTER